MWKEGSSMPKSYKITVTEQQANIIEVACDLFSRIHMGQLDELAFMAIWGELQQWEGHEVDGTIAKIGCDVLKHELFGLPSDTTWGILQCGNDARTACDIHQVIRHRLSWDEHPEGGQTVNFHEPFKSGDGALPSIEEIK